MDSQSNMNPSDVVHEEKIEKEHSALFFTSFVTKQPKTPALYENITFSETTTFVLFDLPQACLFDEDPMTEIIKQKNQKYLDVCQFYLSIGIS